MTSRPRIPRFRLAVLLGGLAMFGPFSIDTIFPAFPEIGRDFDASALALQQTISVYLVAYGLMSVFHGPISDARGRKPVILLGVAVFALASVGCALAATLPQLLVFRALQGISAGAGLIVGRAIVRDCLQGDDAQRLMSNITLIFGIAPALAPIIGGWILGWSDWRAIFWFLSGFAVVLFAATAVALPETHPPAHRSALKLRTLWLGSRRILANRQFLLLALAGSFNFGALFLYIASAPAFVIGLMGLDQQQFGWFFVPMIGGMMLGAFLSGRLAGRLSAARAADLGFVLCGLALLSNLAYNAFVPEPSAPWAVLPIALNAVGIALVFPILTLAILDLYPRQRGAASSMQAFVSLNFNAVLAGVVSPWASGSGMHLALLAASFSLVAWILWCIYRRGAQFELPPGSGSEAVEPVESL